jgi:hypothetical protein
LFAHFFIGSLNFWKFGFLSSIYILLLIPCQIYSWQRFSPILRAACQAGDCFLHCAESLVSCSPICLCFILIVGLSVFYSGSYEMQIFNCVSLHGIIGL